MDSGLVFRRQFCAREDDWILGNSLQGFVERFEAFQGLVFVLGGDVDRGSEAGFVQDLLPDVADVRKNGRKVGHLSYFLHSTDVLQT